VRGSFAISQSCIYYTAGCADTHHRDDAGPAGVLEQLDFLALSCLSIDPSITEPESVLEGLLSDDLHGVGKFALVGSCHLTASSQSQSKLKSMYTSYELRPRGSYSKYARLASVNSVILPNLSMSITFVWGRLCFPARFDNLRLSRGGADEGTGVGGKEVIYVEIRRHLRTLLVSRQVNVHGDCSPSRKSRRFSWPGNAYRSLRV